MAPLAVPHHFLRVSPLCNNLFLHDFVGIEGEKKKKVCFICKAGSSRRDVSWFVCKLHPLPLPLPLSPPSRFLTLWSGLPWVRRPGWALITGRRSLWFDSCRRCSVERFTLQLQKKKKNPMWWEGREYVNSSAANVAPVSRQQMASALHLQPTPPENTTFVATASGAWCVIH